MSRGGGITSEVLDHLCQLSALRLSDAERLIVERDLLKMILYIDTVFEDARGLSDIDSSEGRVYESRSTPTGEMDSPDRSLTLSTQELQLLSSEGMSGSSFRVPRVVDPRG